MKSQVLCTVWCYISGEAAGEVLNLSPLPAEAEKASVHNRYRALEKNEGRFHSGDGLNTQAQVLNNNITYETLCLSNTCPIISFHVLSSHLRRQPV